MNTAGLESDDRASIREILSKQALQPKLKIGAPNDKYEQEADRVADEVMRMSEPLVQSQTEEDEEEELLQRKSIAEQTTPFVQRQAIALGDAERQFWLSLGKQPHYSVLERKRRTPIAMETGIQAADEVLWTAEAIVKEMEMRTFLKSRFGEDKDLRVTSIVKPGHHTQYKKMDVVPEGSTTWEELSAAAVHAGFWVHAEGITLYGTFWPLSPDATGAHFDLYLIKRQVGDFPSPPTRKKPEDETVQTKETSGGTNTGVKSELVENIETLKGGGQSLSNSIRDYFEPIFGQDLSQVRVHADSKADEAANSANAEAFTVGKDIIFRAGQYSSETNMGRRLLAHELTHVVQQGFGINHTQKPDMPNMILKPRNSSKHKDNAAPQNYIDNRHGDLPEKSIVKLSPLNKQQVQHRVINEEYSTAGYETGPWWDVYLKIWRVPEEDTEYVNEFVLACENGVKSAILMLGSGKKASSRTIKIEVPYRDPLFPGYVEEQCRILAINSVLKNAPSPERIPELGRGETPEVLWEKTYSKGRVDKLSPNHYILWNFAVGEFSLKPEFEIALDEIGRRWPNFNMAGTGMIDVEGHASSSNTEKVNRRLSWRRALGVKSYLWNLNENIPWERISIAAFGETKPRFANITPSSMARNRRVEIKLQSLITPTAGPKPEPERTTEPKKERARKVVIWSEDTKYFILDYALQIKAEATKQNIDSIAIAGVVAWERQNNPLGWMSDWVYQERQCKSGKISPTAGIGYGSIHLDVAEAIERAGGVPRAVDISERCKRLQDPTWAIRYIATIMNEAAENYERITGLNIREQPDILSTLFHTGNSKEKAEEKKKAIDRWEKEGKKGPFPKPKPDEMGRWVYAWSKTIQYLLGI